MRVMVDQLKHRGVYRTMAGFPVAMHARVVALAAPARENAIDRLDARERVGFVRKNMRAVEASGT